MSTVKRPLFVFAGQSNMEGGAAYPPSEQIRFSDSYEYLHKPRRFGEERGVFKKTAYPAGEFSYEKLDEAYSPLDDFRSLSSLNTYFEHTFFVPAMSNLKNVADKSVYPFEGYSEANFVPSPCLPPYLVRDWEARGHVCAYAHIAKGAVSIEHYLNPEMLARFDRERASIDGAHDARYRPAMTGAAGAYFDEKTRDFFADSEARFPNDDLSVRALFWLQGESDPNWPQAEYLLALRLFWEQARSLGFTHFFCIRVGNWRDDAIINVIRAQEQFFSETEGAYMLTRVSSYFPMPGRDESGWFIETPPAETQNCRDSWFGFANDHYNQKAFELISARCVPNMERILYENKPPVLEPELLRGLR